MSEGNNLLVKAEQYVAPIFQNQLSSKLTYHNLDHTMMVVDTAATIGKFENLNEEEMETVLLAAWFHDTGFRDTYEGHEEKSRLIAESFLKGENVAPEKIEKVLGCITATEPDHEPQNKLEEILSDANMVHLSKKKYEKYADRLRTELEQVKGEKHSDLEWYEQNIEFVSKYKFHTAYGQENYEKNKQDVRDKLQKKVNKLQKEVDSSMLNELGVTPGELKELKKKLKKVEGRPERGIETMFRLTSSNHITLSTMADSKANIMISVNSIIISILIGGLMQKLDSNPHLIIPTIILLTVNLVSMIFSILSIRPSITSGRFTREEIEKHRTNLLFFGNFHKMKREDYHWGMNRLMDNASFLYSSLIDDIYFLGVVLARKYRFLRYSYNAFMYGIVIAVLAFIISNIFIEAAASFQ